MKPMSDVNVILRTKLFDAGIISNPFESDEYWPVHMTYSGRRLPFMLDKYQYKLICDLFNTFREMRFYGGEIWLNRVHPMMCLAADPSMFMAYGADRLDIKHGLVFTRNLSPMTRIAINAFCGGVPEFIPNTWIALFVGLYFELNGMIYRSPGSPYDLMNIIDAYKLIFSREFCGEGTKAEALDWEDITDEVI